MDQGSSKEVDMSGGSGSFLEIQPSELAFPCKSFQISYPDQAVWIMLGCSRDCSFLSDLGQSWDLGTETWSAILPRWICDTLTSLVRGGGYRIESCLL